MGEKSRISLLLPYRKRNGEIVVFLQKRSEDMRLLPGYFGFFGGHAEGKEKPEETLRREIKEELDFEPEGYGLLGRYDFPGDVKHAFALKVEEDFENTIHVLEGDYGRYFTAKEVAEEPKLIEDDKVILRDFFKRYAI